MCGRLRLVSLIVSALVLIRECCAFRQYHAGSWSGRKDASVKLGKHKHDQLDSLFPLPKFRNVATSFTFVWAIPSDRDKGGSFLKEGALFDTDIIHNKIKDAKINHSVPNSNGHFHQVLEFVMKKVTTMRLALAFVLFLLATTLNLPKNTVMAEQWDPAKASALAANLNLRSTTVTTTPDTTPPPSSSLSPSRLKYWDAQRTATPSIVAEANERLLDYAVGTINTMYLSANSLRKDGLFIFLLHLQQQQQQSPHSHPRGQPTRRRRGLPRFPG